jgi:hypothetical protein
VIVYACVLERKRRRSSSWLYSLTDKAAFDLSAPQYSQYAAMGAMACHSFGGASPWLATLSEVR